MLSQTCDRSASELVGFVVVSFRVEATISCFVFCRAITMSVTRQHSSVTSRVFVQVEANNIWLILSIREGLGCFWSIELRGESQYMLVALEATCGLACNIVF